MSTLHRVALAALLPVLLVTVAGSKKEKTSDLLLPDGFPPVTQEERDLKEVPYAKGAPAVVLLNACQRYVLASQEGLLERIHFYRRLKILTEAGKENHGDFGWTLFGDWRVHKVEARTILPDGAIVEAKDKENVFQDKSDTGMRTIRIAWPKVEVGAILDLHLAYATDGVTSDRWTLQERLPVLQSQFALVIPPGFTFRTGAVRIPQDQAQPVSFKHAMGGVEGAGMGSALNSGGYAVEREATYRMMGTAHVWRFRNVEPVPEEPHQPPLEDISQALLIIPDAYRNEAVYIPIASDWKSWGKNLKEDWDLWLKSGTANAAALAKQVSEGKSTPREKAEAVRRALRERVRVDYRSLYRSAESADEVLAHAAGTSADVAGLAVAMLRAVGVGAHLAAIRRRSDGILPRELPLPTLISDVLVRISGEADPVYWSPADDLPVGKLAWDCRGILTLPLDGTSDAPVAIPDYRPSENKSLRVVNAGVDPASGTLTAESQLTYDGVAAQKWRQRLRPVDEAGRREAVRNAIRRWTPGAELTSLEIENLEDESKSLVLRASWMAEGYATVAGKRLVLNPNLLGRVDAAEWPVAERRFDIDLGEARQEMDVVILKLPEFFKEVALPQRAVMDAAPAGRYEIAYERQPRAVSVRRNMTLDAYRFSANAYAGLKKWLGDVAAADEQPVVITLP